MLPDEFRVNHRAASESLLRAAASESVAEVEHELGKAVYFENEAVKHISTHRQRALSMGLLHAIDLMRAVAAAEFHNDL